MQIRAGRARTAVSIAAAALMTLSAAALAVLAFGTPADWQVGPATVTLNDYKKPLAWGLAAAGGLLIAGGSRARWRRYALTGAVVVAILGLVAFSRLASPVITDADLAVGELYTALESDGLLMVGPYSRFGWHHPGPLYFYVAAPLYVLAEQHALALYGIALLINVAAAAIILRVTLRASGSPHAGVLIAIACAIVAWRAPGFLASPWTAHITNVSSLTFLVLAAAVLAGHWRVLPWLAACASFVAQTHVAFVPLVGILTGGVIVSRTLREGDRTIAWRWINRSAWVAAVLWAIPIAEAVTGRGGNLASLWSFFVAGGTRDHSLREAFVAWTYGASGVLRPAFELGWGGHFDMPYRTLALFVGSAQFALLAVALRSHRRNRRVFDTSLVSVALGASLITLWSLTRVRGDILSHDMFRLAVLGAFNLALIASAAITTGMPYRSPSSWTASRRTAAAVLALGLVAATGFRDLDTLTAFERRRTDREAIVAASVALRDYMTEHHLARPQIAITGDAWGEAAGVVLRLRRAGFVVGIDRRHEAMFTPALTLSEDADVRFTFVGPGADPSQNAGEPVFQARSWWVGARQPPP